MSRGYGRIQRAVIAHLMELRNLTTESLCELIYRDEPITPSKIRGMSRLLNKLMKENVVKRSGTFTRGGIACWIFTGVKADHENKLRKLQRRRRSMPRLIKG